MKKLVVFISHITEEKEIAASLKKLVESTFMEMIDVFVSSDSTSITPGRRWLDEITSALKNCAVEIILASPDSVNRPWINFEGGAGWIRDIPVIPLCHSGMSPSRLPAPLKALQAATATVEAELKTIFPVLAKALGSANPEPDFGEFITVVREFETTSLQIKAMAEITPVATTDGFAPHELATLVEIANQTSVPGDYIPMESVRKTLGKSGHRGVAIALGLSVLSRKDFVELSTDSDWNGNAYSTVRVSSKGWAWLEAHVGLLSLTNEPAQPKPESAQQFTEDDIPF